MDFGLGMSDFGFYLRRTGSQTTNVSDLTKPLNNANHELKKVCEFGLKLQVLEKLKKWDADFRGFLKKLRKSALVRVHPRPDFDTFHNEF